jgi:hypothetical protein
MLIKTCVIILPNMCNFSFIFQFHFIKIGRDWSWHLHLKKDRFKKIDLFKTTYGGGLFKSDWRSILSVYTCPRSIFLEPIFPKIDLNLLV